MSLKLKYISQFLLSGRILLGKKRLDHRREVIMSKRNLTLLTDLYELTMMQGYYENQSDEIVVFDAFYRNNPSGSGYSICAGLEQIVDYIKSLHFTDGDIEYLRSLGIFKEDFRVLQYGRKVCNKEKNPRYIQNRGCVPHLFPCKEKHG